MYEGRSIAVDWPSQTDKMVALAYTLPNGELLVHRPPDLGLQPPTYAHWAAHPLDAEWVRRKVDPFIGAFREAGIVNYYDGHML